VLAADMLVQASAGRSIGAHRKIGPSPRPPPQRGEGDKRQRGCFAMMSCTCRTRLTAWSNGRSHMLRPNITPFAQTDDMRPGLGWQGVENLSKFVSAGGVLLTSENTADFAQAFGFADGVSITHPPRLHVVGTLLRTKIVDDASPLVYGLRDSLAVYSDAGMSFTITNVLGTRGGRRG